MMRSPKDARRIRPVESWKIISRLRSSRRSDANWSEVTALKGPAQVEVPEVEHAARNCIAAHCDVLPGRHPEVGPLKFLIGERRLNCEFDGLKGGCPIPHSQVGPAKIRSTRTRTAGICAECLVH